MWTIGLPKFSKRQCMMWTIWSTKWTVLIVRKVGTSCCNLSKVQIYVRRAPKDEYRGTTYLFVMKNKINNK